jgi:hypothetical protein
MGKHAYELSITTTNFSNHFFESETYFMYATQSSLSEQANLHSYVHI